MQNLLIIITTLNPGGAERIVWQLATGLKKYRVIVAALDGRGEYSERLLRDGIKVHDLQCYSSLHLPAAILKVRRIIRKENISLVNTHLFHAGIVGRLAAWGTGTSVIGTCHIAERRASARWRFFLDRLTSRLAAGEICVSEFVKTYQIANTGITGDFFHAVPNGIDHGRFKPALDRDILRRELGIKPESFVLGFLGRFDYQKGADIFVDIMQSPVLADRHFVKLIAGYGEMEGQLRMAAGEDLRFCGYYEQPEKFLQLLDVCIMPSRWEGFGLVAVEAMACGAVVVASAVDSLSEVLAHGEAGVLMPKQSGAEEWGGALHNLMLNPQRLYELQEKGLRKALDYTVDNMIKGYEQVFECLQMVK